MNKRNKALADAIEKEEINGTLAIMDETDTDIVTDDFDDDRIIAYHLVPPDKEWLLARIRVTPNAAAYGMVDTGLVADLLLSVDPEMLTTLKHIFFVANGDDPDEICRIAGADPEWEFPETIDLEENGLLGCHWWSQSSVIIDVTAIRNTVNEVAAEAETNGYGYFNAATEERIGVLTTVLHEIRHLGLSNPFLNGDGYTDSERTEEAVERWAIEAYEDWSGA